MSFVKHKFYLDSYTEDYLRSLIPPFGYNGLGEITFYRTYSRIKKDGGQEDWADCVVRVTNGTFSIRKNWYIKNHIHWDENFWQDYAKGFAESMFLMQWLPPGRGLWAMGSDFVYERGAMTLYNCAFTEFTDDIGDDLEWFMDSLMHGVGCGFEPIRNDNLRLHSPHGIEDYIIPDTREGWCACSRAICDSYLKPNRRKIKPHYDNIRLAGEPIKGFGGVSAGPEPLMYYHQQLISFFERYQERKEYDSVRLKADIGNACGVCVVAGNVRRSAELMKGKISDPVFMDLKNYKKYPERAEFGWMSNNSVALETDEDFQMLGEIAKRVIKNGEPGYINMRNLPYGRIGKKMKGLRKDKAKGFNPCITGSTEIMLADGRGCQRIDSLLGTDPLVYCVNEKDEIVVRQMRNVRKTGEQQKILKIIFDDGNFIRVTEKHKIMLRDRSFKEARQLSSGDSIALINRYIPVDCKDVSLADNYVTLSFGGQCRIESRLICEYIYGPLKDNEEVHHKDKNRLNNNPFNLEPLNKILHGSEHSSGSMNMNYSGFTHEEIFNFGINLCLRLKRRFSTEEWKKYGPIKTFSEWRRERFGSIFDFACLCADIAEVRNEQLDTRTLRFLNEMLEQGYEADIVNKEVEVYKICEGCKNGFWIAASRREQACCSLSCNNTIRDYSKNIEGQRKFYSEKKKDLGLKQLDVFTDLKAKLGRIPKKEEWQIVCRDQGISSEICRDSSPFKSWNDLISQSRDHNHKVVIVLEDGFEDVYNGTVDEYHNYVIKICEEVTDFGRKVEKGLFSPQCGEIGLEHREVCNVDETAPTICNDPIIWIEKACPYASFYCSTVSLLPTHQPSTNRVVARNRRIGVSIIDYTGWKQEHGVHKVIQWMRQGYDKIRSTNKWANEEAGIPLSIRLTTIKPGGTTPKLPGKTPGIGYPNFSYTIRRIRIAKNAPIHPLLVEAGIPFEQDKVDRYTDVFEYPIIQGPAKPADQVTLWEQAFNLITVQREWADNAVSNTLNFRPMWPLVRKIEENFVDELSSYIGFVEANLILYIHERDKYEVPERFKIKIEREDGEIRAIKIYEYDPKHEENDIEAVLSAIAPLTKSVSLLPHSNKGVYSQMPEEGITKEEYEARLSQIRKVDWSKFEGSDGEDEKYCSSQGCEIPIRS